MTEFVEELQVLLNKHSMEDGSNTPDFILAQYLQKCLDNFNWAVNRRAEWYGRKDEPALLHPRVTDSTWLLHSHDAEGIHGHTLSQATEHMPTEREHVYWTVNKGTQDLTVKEAIQEWDEAKRKARNHD